MKKWFAVLCCLLMALPYAWGQDFTITFNETTTKNPGYASESFTSDGVEFAALRCYGGDDGASGESTDKALRVQHAGKGENITNGYFATAHAFSSPISRISFDYKAGGASHTNRQWALETSTDGENWEPVMTVTTAEGWLTADTDDLEEGGIPADSTYFRIISANTGTQARLANFDNVKVWLGPAEFGVTLSIVGVEGTVVPEGTDITLVAEPQNGPVGASYSFEWSGCGTGTEQTLALGTLAANEYTASCKVTIDGTETFAEDDITFTVAAVYTITSYESEDGNVTADKDSALAGETIELTVSAASGKVLDKIYTNGVELAGTSFSMPAENVAVTADFVDYEGGDLTITFDANKTTDPGYASTSFTSDTLPEEAADVEFDALRCYGGDAGFSGKAMRVQNVNGTNGFFATAKAFEKPISRIRFAYKAYNAASADKDWVLQTSTDGSGWTTVATVAPASHEEWATADATDTIPANSVYFRITGLDTNTTKSAWSADFDEIDIWFGEATYHVELTGVENGARVPYDEDNPAVTLTAKAKDGGQEPFTYEWTINGEPVDGYTESTYDFSTLGAYEVSVTCTDANGVTTEPVGVSFTIEKQYTVNLPDGVTGGSILAEPLKAFEGETVTVTATPSTEGEEVYALEAITVSYTDTALSFDASPAEFVMPAEDVDVGGSFRVVQDTAALPFEWHGPWREKLGSLDGVTGALGADGSDKNYEDQGNGVANFGAKSHFFQVKFDGKPGTVSYWIHGTAYETNAYTFQVQESADGEAWSDVAVYTSTDEGIGGYAQVTNELKEASRYVKFSFLERSAGSVGVDGIVIAKGEGGGGDEPVEVTATVTGDITFADGKAKLSVSIDNNEVVPTADDIWAASELVDEESEGYWKQAEGATIVPTNDGSYEVTVPEAAGNYISIGKPKFLNAE